MTLTQNTVLLTGATGFIGSHLCRRLLRQNASLHLLLRSNARAGTFEGIPAERIHVFDGTTECMRAIVGRINPTLVLHLASCFIAQHKPEDVTSLIESNVRFATQLVDAAAEAGVPYFINTGTAWQHYDNRDYSASCLYAATKQAFQDILQYYAEATPLKAITLQIFDTYGPGDPRRKLVAALKQAVEQDLPLTMTDGEQLLDLVHIDDIVEAYVVAAQRLMSGAANGHEIYALSSGQPASIKTIVETFERLSGKHLQVEWGARPYRPREIMWPWDRGEKLPGWAPRVDLAEGVRRLLAVG